MSNRFDNRSVSTFKKDIKFGTQLESYFFNKWLEVCVDDICHWNHNGCGNDGEFIAKGNTSGADYMVSGTLLVKPYTQEVTNHPLEIKWVPTAGKFTLKENDLKSYVRERASILFIYNTGSAKLKKPSDYNLEKHINLIEANASDIRYGIMWWQEVKNLYEFTKEEGLFRPIYYMGNKSGVVLKSKDFDKYFVEREWTTK
tara:strand:- start:95 stop:694 length:600 start_codon:yes stop_codon:yes gene_type:complete